MLHLVTIKEKKNIFTFICQIHKQWWQEWYEEKRMRTRNSLKDLSYFFFNNFCLCFFACKKLSFFFHFHSPLKNLTLPPEAPFFLFLNFHTYFFSQYFFSSGRMFSLFRIHKSYKVALGSFLIVFFMVGFTLVDLIEFWIWMLDSNILKIFDIFKIIWN